MSKVAEHFIWKGVKIEDVNVGEYVDMEAGLFLRKNADSWSQIDGGYVLEVPESDVKVWLDESLV